MNTINVDLSTGEALNLPIGRQGENNVTQVIFDFSALKTEFGSGTLSLSVKRPKEYVPYAQTMTVSGTNATWLVNETDTGNFGCGEIQLTYTVSGKVAKTVIYKYTVLRSIGADGEYPIPGQTWQEEMEDEIEGIKEDLAELEGGGLSDGAKQALLDCIAHIGVWSDEHGQDYYDALESALFPPANLTSISCVYTQSGTVYNTDSLDDLKTDLVVTAHYDNGTTSTVTTYTLTGTLAVGTSVITVSYGGFTTTFNVTVTEYVIPPLYSWNFRNNNLTDSIAGLVAATNASQGTDGITFNAANQYIALNTSSTMSLLGKRVEIDIESMSDTAQSIAGHGRVFGVTTNNTYATNTNTDCWIRRSTGGWYAYSSSWSSEVLSSSDYNGSYFSGKTLVLTFDDTGKMTVSVNGTNLITYSTAFSRTGYFVLGGSNTDQLYRLAPTISAVRIY